MTPYTLLAVLLSLSLPGRSFYSVVRVPEAECARERETVCADATWSDAHRSWVRQETAEQATQRLWTVANALSRVVETSTRGQDGKPALWPWSSRDLALGLATIAYHESGFRRDVHEGVGDSALGDCSYTDVRGRPLTELVAKAQHKAGKPVHRHCRSVCLVQVNLGGLDGVTASGVRGRDLVGTDLDSTERCLAAGAAALAKARTACQRRQATGHWFRSAVTQYGSGYGCASSQDWVVKRVETYNKAAQAPRELPAAVLQQLGIAGPSAADGAVASGAAR